MSWGPIDVFSACAADRMLLAVDCDGALRELRVALAAEWSAQGLAPEAITDRLDQLEAGLRRFARASADQTIVSARSRLLKNVDDAKT